MRLVADLRTSYEDTATTAWTLVSGTAASHLLDGVNIGGASGLSPSELLTLSQSKIFASAGVNVMEVPLVQFSLAPGTEYVEKS